MVGGDEDAYRDVEPILRELGTPNYIGGNGQGLALKLAINISLAVQMLAFAEGLLLAERSGVDRQRALDVMESSPIGSPMLKARASIILDPPEEAWFDLASCTRTSSSPSHAEAIYATLAAGRMPWDGAWTDENVRRFRSWLDTGARPWRRRALSALHGAGGGVVSRAEAPMDVVVDHADVLHERVDTRRPHEAVPLRLQLLRERLRLRGRLG
jgi:NAD-binding of NADP-dependent 3-hydroxyisobutyrate dehydrogenase